MDGPIKARLAPEGANEFDGRAEPVERRDPENIGVVKVQDALVGVLGQECVENGASLVAVFREHVALLHIVGPLATSQWLGVEGDMADQVKGIEVLAQLFDDGVKWQPFGLQFVDDGLLTLGSIPAFQEVVEAGEALAQRLLGEVA